MGFENYIYFHLSLDSQLPSIPNSLDEITNNERLHEGRRSQIFSFYIILIYWQHNDDASWRNARTNKSSSAG